MDVLILSCSLDPDSRSHLLARAAETALARHGARVQLIDLRQMPLPLCDGNEAYHDPRVGALRRAIEQAAAVLVAVPIYNFDVNAAAKNIVELTGRAWTDKVVGFLCAAGGRASYMSVMGLANSLMLDFRCLILPRFVYATGDAFTNDAVTSDKINQRIEELAADLLHVAGALRQAPRSEHVKQSL